MTSPPANESPSSTPKPNNVTPSPYDGIEVESQHSGRFFSHEAFVRWITEQPDDQPVNMKQTYIDDPCGCLLVQFGRLLPDVSSSFGAGYSNIGPIRSDNRLATSLLISEAIKQNSTTFGAVKRLEAFKATNMNS